MAEPAKMLQWMKDNAVMKNVWDKTHDEKKFGDKFPIGLFYKAESETYDVAYHKIIEMAGGTAK